ncbi:hypothetical protein M2T59_31760, partial [Klebsiella pneumoniae]|nr:hypothetical protein [Klebsiella pneumoniae]
PAPAPDALRAPLDAILRLDGAIGAAVADIETGLTIAAAGGSSEINVEVAAASNSAFVRTKRDLLRKLEIDDTLEDIVVILTTQIHILRPLPNQ